MGILKVVKRPVMVFTSKARAKKFINEYKKKGYKIRIERTKKPADRVYLISGYKK